MTDPERISRRSHGLAAQLLRASAEEQPGEVRVQRALAALGVTAAVVTTTAAAGAATAGGTQAVAALGASVGVGAGAGGAGVMTGGAVKAASALLLVKWIALGVVGGVGLAGVAALATRPPEVSSAAPVAPSSTMRSSVPVATSTPSPQPRPATLVSAQATAPSAPPRVDLRETEVPPPVEVGAPLAAEVAYVDRARGLVAAGRLEPGLLLLQSYDHEFPEARLLPEVLFLRLEASQRLGRHDEARAAAQRLLDGFPKSPHTARARALLAE